MLFKYLIRVIVSFILALVLYTVVFNRTVSSVSVLVIWVTCTVTNVILMRRK